ncbi:MAG: RagB/SusD family nutrient uptake outer membrane protein [Prevotellaceae bacterium]|jgi:hypothetical protein|nr:RagB/SusD family nutrient uptake outer membrane protein [Prevotellaceae bacterium]
MKRIINTLVVAGGLFFLGSCTDYLDVVPDNVATLDIVFNNRSSAERYLFSCYSFVPEYGSIDQNPGMTAGHEAWRYTITGDRWVGGSSAFLIATGLQNTAEPYNDYWDGERDAKPMFRAIRECNIFLEYVSQPGRVRDLAEPDRRRWVAEANILKAFYHYFLFHLYGPIPITDTYVPISASPEEVKVTRLHVDTVVSYMVRLIDQSYQDLPPQISLRQDEMGRLTQPAALAIKAKILLLAASPLFNSEYGENAYYVNFRNKEGEPLISTTYSREKWEKAAQAAYEAIELAHANGHELYDFKKLTGADLPEELHYGMNIRAAITERFNPELVWSVGTQGTGWLQNNCMPCICPGLTLAKITGYGVLQYCARATYAPTLETAERFYSSNGVPINEDIEWVERGDYLNRYSAREIPVEPEKLNTYSYNMQATNESGSKDAKGQTHTAVLNFNREPRFYGSLGFDGGTWFGNGWNSVVPGNSTVNYIDAKKERESGSKWGGLYSVTGYFAKKLVHYENEISQDRQTVFEYPFPIIRLADLYLMYAEALNEAYGTEKLNDVRYYLRLIRERGGLKKGVLGQTQDVGDIMEAWAQYSSNPGKPRTREGLREIIRHERQIELALEGQQYHDLRRWCIAEKELSKPVRGWNVNGGTVEEYYNVTTLYIPPAFTKRNYLWPIKENDLQIDNKLVQTYGW